MTIVAQLSQRLLAIASVLFCFSASHCRALGQPVDTSWLTPVRQGDVFYVALPDERRLESYDLAQRKWLSRIDLTGEATALRVDPSGIYIAYGDKVVRRGLNGQGESLVYNAPAPINAIFANDSFLFICTESSTYSVHKSTGALADTIQFGTSRYLQIGQVVARNSLFWTDSTGLVELPYGSDGRFSAVRRYESLEYNSNCWMYVSPTGAVLLRSSGTVVDTGTWFKRGSLPQSTLASIPFSDVAFFSDHAFAALRDGRLAVYGKDWLEAGSVPVDPSAKSVAIKGDRIFVFCYNALSSSKVRVQIFPLSRVTKRDLFREPDPNVSPFKPDDVVPLGDDTFLMISRLYMKGFRWSAGERRFVSSLNFTSPPIAVGYDSTKSTLYTAYRNQISRQAYPAESPEETILTNSATNISGMVRMDDRLLVVQEPIAPLFSQFPAKVYSTDGIILDELLRGVRNYVWNSPKKLLFSLDSSSYSTASVSASGEIGTFTSRSFDYSERIWLRPDGEIFLTQRGLAYHADSGTYVGAISNSIRHAAFVDQRWITARPRDFQTQVQLWTPGMLLDAAWSLPGAPVYLFPLLNGDALIITQGTHGITPSILRLTAGSTPASPPYIVQQPDHVDVILGSGAVLTVNAIGSGLSYQWMRNDVEITGATGTSLSLTDLKPATAGNFSVRISNAYGSIVATPVSVTVSSPNRAERPDFNEGFFADVLLQNVWTGDRSILAGVLNTQSSTVALGTVPTEWTIVGMADFNADAETDLVWQSRTTGELVIQLFEGANLRTHRSLGAVDPEWRVVGVADFDRDGYVDLLWQNQRTRELRLWYMEEMTLRSTAVLPGSPEDWYVVGAADFNGDNYPDILWRHRRLGTLAGWQMIDSLFVSGFSLGTISPVWEVAQLSDFDSDGSVDILWHNISTGSLAEWKMNGTSFVSSSLRGTVWPSVRPGPAPRLRLAAADFNHDGASDLLVRLPNTGAYAYLPVGGGSSATSVVSLPGAAQEWTRVGSIDLNNDGQTDAVWRNTSTGAVATWIMRGTQVLDSAVIATVPTAWKIAGLGDFDSHGASDLVWRNSSTGELAIWGLIDGRLSGQYYGLGTVPTEWQLVGVDDLNGDTATDLLWVNSSTGQLVGWAMSGRSFTSALYLGSLPAGWSVVQVADFNGDLIADVCRQETATGTCVIDFSNGTTLTGSLTLPNVVPAGAKVGHAE